MYHHMHFTLQHDSSTLLMIAAKNMKIE